MAQQKPILIVLWFHGFQAHLTYLQLDEELDLSIQSSRLVVVPARNVDKVIIRGF